jgi:disulfide bond formation protein DsbB
MNRSQALMLNTLALYALAGVLVAAFAMQFALDELPCPLCLLQRAFFCALAIGPILNLRYGPHPLHYGLSMLAAIAGAAVIGLTLANVASTVAICGFTACPDNPVVYELFSAAPG